MKLLNIFVVFTLLFSFTFWYNLEYFNSLPQQDKEIIQLINWVNSSVVSITWKKKYEKTQVNCLFLIWNICLKSAEKTQSTVQTWYTDIIKWTWFFISKSWFIITNKHVVNDDWLEYDVYTLDGKVYSAKFLYKSSKTDIALLKVDWNNFTPVKLWNSNNIMVWQSVLAIWNALWQYQNTVTRWIITWLNRSLLAWNWPDDQESLDNAIQTDASINVWNSWWPLIDAIWNVIWINTAIDLWWQNIWFAIPSNKIIDFLKEYVDYLKFYN